MDDYVSQPVNPELPNGWIDRLLNRTHVPQRVAET